MAGPVETNLDPGASDRPGLPGARWPATIGFAVAVVAVLAGLAFLLRPRPSAEVVWNEARSAFMDRDFGRADAALGRLAALRDPTEMDWMLRAQVAMGMHRDDEAFEDLKHVSDGNPMAAAARLEMGQMELRRDRFATAERYFLESIQLDPKQVQPRRELIYIYGTQMRRGDLNRTFRDLAERSALTYPEVFLWCMAQGVTWEPREIIVTLAKAIQADPTDRWAHLGRATSLIGLNRFDEAEAMLASFPPTDADARALRVQIALGRGDDVEAETLLDGGPDDHAGLALLRGQFALARGDAKATLHHYRIAYQKAPYLREAVFGLGKALQLNGDPTAATYIDLAYKFDLLATLIQKAAVEANRKDIGLIRDLGAACAAAGRTAEARAWYNIAILRDPLDTKAHKALAALGESDPSATAPR